MPLFRFPYQGAPLLGALLRNESGGRNVIQGDIGDVNNRTGDLAKGYFQITDATWRDFGGLHTGYARASDAPYTVQAQIAAGIPLKRWGPSTIAAMQKTGKPIDTNRTLGENLAAQGENFGANATITPGGTPPADDAPPVSDQLTGAEKQKPLAGLLGELAQRGGGGQMQPMQLIQPSAGQPGGGDSGTLADIVQKYLATQRRGQQPQQG